ncbi:hypothetical protein F2P81_006977 [Scophthalmus maximus]|uniref:Uncharacterized protein n=1 Tax=Scophthalmus maximus TaxID=52904 RepID=A0A6A4T8A3_SCOMX|nr:hypothetical protein F2P81_006977 [Scophthalmus maximus]
MQEPQPEITSRSQNDKAYYIGDKALERRFVINVLESQGKGLRYQLDSSMNPLDNRPDSLPAVILRGSTLHVVWTTEWNCFAVYTSSDRPYDS